MIDPRISDEAAERILADVTFYGEVNETRLWVGRNAIGLSVLVAMCGFAVALDVARNSKRGWESLSWDQRKVKASEIVRSQRNSAD